MTKISYSGYRFPPEIIHQAIWLYLRFTLSFRDVEDLLAERGILISYETVRRWVNHFGPIIALGAFESSALAQENTIAWTCQENGAAQLEPLGDREGHSILVEEPSCRAETGPLAGGVQTSVFVWEWDGPNATLLSGSGVIRKPGATVVWKGRGESRADDGRRQSDRLDGVGTRRLCVGDRQLGLNGRQVVHLDGKAPRNLANQKMQNQGLGGIGSLLAPTVRYPPPDPSSA